jgi:hypothetical protein
MSVFHLRARSIAGSYRIPGGSVDRFSSPGFEVDRAVLTGLLGPGGTDIWRSWREVRPADQTLEQSSSATSLGGRPWRPRILLTFRMDTLYLNATHKPTHVIPGSRATPVTVLL